LLFKEHLANVAFWRVRIAVIVETASQSMQQTNALIDFPQQQSTTV
jgi:hypothetical protein